MAWNFQIKNSTTWSSQTKTPVEHGLYTEDNFILLQEGGDQILIEDTSVFWSNPTRATTTWSNPIKN